MRVWALDFPLGKKALKQSYHDALFSARFRRLKARQVPDLEMEKPTVKTPIYRV